MPFEILPRTAIWCGWRLQCEDRDQLAQDALRKWAPHASQAMAAEEEEEVDDAYENTPPEIKIHNIVSTTLLTCADMPINLQKLSIFLPSSSYNRRRFAAITIRVHNTAPDNMIHFTALLFTSGKLVVTGQRSWYGCVLAALSISKLLNDTNMVSSKFTITNCEVRASARRYYCPSLLSTATNMTNPPPFPRYRTLSHTPKYPSSQTRNSTSRAFMSHSAWSARTRVRCSRGSSSVQTTAPSSCCASTPQRWCSRAARGTQTYTGAGACCGKFCATTFADNTLQNRLTNIFIIKKCIFYNFMYLKSPRVSIDFSL